MRVLTKLRAKHAEGGSTWGIDGDKGTLVDMREYGVWEPEAVKLQSIKTAIEVCCAFSPLEDYLLTFTTVSMLAAESR